MINDSDGQFGQRNHDQFFAFHLGGKTAFLLLQGTHKKYQPRLPYSSLESVIKNSEEGYYLALHQTQGTIRTEAPNWHIGITGPQISSERSWQRWAGDRGFLAASLASPPLLAHLVARDETI